MWFLLQGWLQSLGAFFWGWATVDILVGIAATTVAILEPPIVAALIPDLRKWAIAIAVVAFTLTGTIAYGYKNGIDEKQRQWDAASHREIINGEKARSDAESTVRNESPDGVRNDPRNRDNWGKQPDGRAARPVRWLAAYRFFGAKR